MNKYTCQNRRLYIFFLTIGQVIIIIGLLILAPSYTSFSFFLGAVSSLIVLLAIPQVVSKKITIDNVSILESEKKMHLFYKEIKKELRWDEVGYIYDDYVQPILFYPPYKLHIFHLMQKDTISKSFTRISISWWITDYKDLLSQVVSRVGSDTKIDDYVRKVVKKIHENK